MSQFSDNREEDTRSRLDVCQLSSCGITIETICWRGTGACGDEHFKAQHGHARVSEVIQERGLTRPEDSAGSSSDEDAPSTEQRSDNTFTGSRRFSNNGSVGSYPRPPWAISGNKLGDTERPDDSGNGSHG